MFLMRLGEGFGYRLAEEPHLLEFLQDFAGDGLGVVRHLGQPHEFAEGAPRQGTSDQKAADGLVVVRDGAPPPVA